ncbi:hypothetical protein MHBO_000312 [Bonamia ostreae]|uniref:Uncharacterized protein n=1 Tax=Bonamia ostreae TaxID=126728 RepID=A0ABV2AF70_9EUKA
MKIWIVCAVLAFLRCFSANAVVSVKSVTVIHFRDNGIETFVEENNMDSKMQYKKIENNGVVQKIKLLEDVHGNKNLTLLESSPSLTQSKDFFIEQSQLKFYIKLLGTLFKSLLKIRLLSSISKNILIRMEIWT